MNYYDQANPYADGYVCSKTICNNPSCCCPPVARGAIIPLFSGTPIDLSTTLADVAGVPVLLGAGTSGTTNTPLVNPMDLTGFTTENVNFAFSVPRAGTMTAVSAYFSITQVGIPVDDNQLILHAQVYMSSNLSQVFTAVPETFLTLTPAVSGPAAPGTVLHGVKNNVAVAVTPETRLLLVVWAVGSAVAPVLNLRGYASAGINIA